MARAFDLKGKCAHCAGGIGFGICTVVMAIGAVGVLGAAAGSSSGMAGMGSGGGSSSGSGSWLSGWVAFFSTPAGTALTVVFVLLMLVGFALARNPRAFVVAGGGAGLLMFGMYGVYSFVFQLVGGVVLGVAYGAVYSDRIARALHLEHTAGPASA